MIGAMPLARLASVAGRIPVILIIGTVLAVTASFQPALADNPTNNVLVALSPIDRSTPVELVAITLDGSLTEVNGHTIVQGTTTFKVHNTDPLQQVTAKVGFPEWAGGALTFDPAQFSSFSVSENNKNVTLVPANAPLKIGKESRTVNWYTFDLTLDPDEKDVIIADFTQDLGEDILPRFTYGLEPSNGWKGSIGSVRLTLTLPTPTTGEQFVALDPKAPQFDGEKLTWLWIDLNPDADPGVTLIRPSFWADLLNKRAAAAQSPDDASLHFLLGRDYQQLAAIDSARRDNFMSQAVAEFETTARLDPKNTDVLITLAQLYETRAGPAAGPRDPNYVALALAEWKNLVGSRVDSDARKNAAEDSYYLGVAANSRGDGEQALRFFQDALKFAPQGAGPLFTQEHLTTEMQGVRLALARSAAEQGQIASALSYAHEALGKDFDFSPAPPIPSFALNHADIVTSDTERRITLSLVTYPSPSAAAQRAVDAVVTALNQVGVGSAARVQTQDDYGIQITVPVTSDRDLMNRLRSMANGFPDREDWAVVSTVLLSPSIQWSKGQDTFTDTMQYEESVDLASLQAPLKLDLNRVSNVIGELEAAAPNDSQAQLRLALLRDAQQWWLREGSTGTATFLFQPAGVPARQWTVRVGEKTTLAYEDSQVRSEWFIIAGLGTLIFTLFVVLVLFIIISFRRRRPKPA